MLTSGSILPREKQAATQNGTQRDVAEVDLLVTDGEGITTTVYRLQVVPTVALIISINIDASSVSGGENFTISGVGFPLSADVEYSVVFSSSNFLGQLTTHSIRLVCSTLHTRTYAHSTDHSFTTHSSTTHSSTTHSFTTHSFNGPLIQRTSHSTDLSFNGLPRNPQ
jgi:hypothetical protein